VKKSVWLSSCYKSDIHLIGSFEILSSDIGFHKALQVFSHTIYRKSHIVFIHPLPQTSLAPKFVFTKIESLCTLPCSDLRSTGTASISVVAPLACILHQSSCDNFSLLEFDEDTSPRDFSSADDDECMESSDRTLPMRECTLRLSWKRGRKVGRQAVKVDAWASMCAQRLFFSVIAAFE
jgi:hypothetical protein